MPPPDPTFPFMKFRLSDDIQRRIRTRAAYLQMGISEYITSLVETDTEDFFQRIDTPAKNHGGR